MLNAFLSFAVLIPAAVLCYLPMKGQLKYSVGRTAAVYGPCLVAVILLAAFITNRFALRENDLLVPLFLICFLFYRFSLKAPLIKTLTVFFVVVSLLAILTNYAACLDARMGSAPTNDSVSPTYCRAQLCLSIIAVLLFAYPFIRFGEPIINQPLSSWVWTAVILFSLAIASLSIAFHPLMYSLYEHGWRGNILAVLTAQLAAWFFMLFLLYSGISDSLAMAKIRDQNRILEMQESQFQSQQKYIKESERVRHDFRHSILTLTELYDTGDTQALGEYLHQFAEEIPVNEYSAFCRNTALNALLNYYVHIAQQNKIDLTLRVNLLNALPISDVELCNMVGNILENAVAACQEAEEKRIHLTILAEDSAQLYIVAVNSFNGIVRQRDGRYLSTKQKRDGVGLASITATAERHGGITQFFHEGNEFFSNVAIPLE